jgi:hypothetical protein
LENGAETKRREGDERKFKSAQSALPELARRRACGSHIREPPDAGVSITNVEEFRVKKICLVSFERPGRL